MLMGMAKREGWFRVLECMKDGEVRTPRELSAETGMPVSEVCRWLDFLEARGLITSPDDSRHDPEDG
jgi:DNA-binding IclR family transcriptional regulator